MHRHSMKDVLMITAGAVAALVIVGWAVFLALAFLSAP
jgi:hypothetical protein